LIFLLKIHWGLVIRPGPWLDNEYVFPYSSCQTAV
jgi:hypothetical protein